MIQFSEIRIYELKWRKRENNILILNTKIGWRFEQKNRFRKQKASFLGVKCSNLRHDKLFCQCLLYLIKGDLNKAESHYFVTCFFWVYYIFFFEIFKKNVNSYLNFMILHVGWIFFNKNKKRKFGKEFNERL